MSSVLVVVQDANQGGPDPQFPVLLGSRRPIRQGAQRCHRSQRSREVKRECSKSLDIPAIWISNPNLSLPRSSRPSRLSCWTDLWCLRSVSSTYMRAIVRRLPRPRSSWCWKTTMEDSMSRKRRSWSSEWLAKSSTTSTSKENVSTGKAGDLWWKRLDFQPPIRTTSSNKAG